MIKEVGYEIVCNINFGNGYFAILHWRTSTGSNGWKQQMGDKGNASQMMEYGKTTRAQQGMHGLGFMHSDGNSFGEYVTFTIDTQTGAILNYVYWAPPFSI